MMHWSEDFKFVINQKELLQTKTISFKYEPRHDKPNKMSVPPAKTQISLGIRPVWSESSRCAQWTQAFFMRTAKTEVTVTANPFRWQLQKKNLVTFTSVAQAT